MYHPPGRNFGCRLTTEGTLRGLRTVVLENQKLRVTVLVDKGSDIWEFLYKPLDIDFTWRAPQQLRDLRFYKSSSSGPGGPWHDLFAGGWQEILPSGGPPSSYLGAEFGLHGESSIIPWEFQVLEDRPERVSVSFWVRMVRTPFYVEKTLSLIENESVLHIEETILNEGRERLPLMWGHHPTLGEAFLDESCVIDTPATKVKTHPTALFDNQRFPPGSEFAWPLGSDPDERPVDISRMLSRSARTADMLYLTDLHEGWFAVTSQKRQLGFGMVWPQEVFPYIWWWQVCGGAFGYPWYGRTYNLALEPFSSYPGGGLAEAVANGTALWLEGGESQSAEMKAVVYKGQGRVARISPTGTVSWQGKEKG
jgi:hypothetical protein